MKSFKLFTQQIDHWQVQLLEIWQRHADRILQAFMEIQPDSKTTASRRFWRFLLRLKSRRLVAIAHRLFRKNESHVKSHRHKSKVPRSQRAAILAMTVILLTSAIGYRFYNEPQLDVGTIAPQTLRAPDSVRVEDVQSTEANRKAARTGAVPVLMIDQTVNQEIYQALQRLLDEGDRLRQQMGAFPFVETSVLSTNTQQYVRQASEDDWKAAITTAEKSGSALPGFSASPSGNSPNSLQQVAILELQNYYQIASDEDFSALKQVILRARQRYRLAQQAIVTTDAREPRFFDTSLLHLTDSEWQNTRTTVREALERILAQGIPPGLPNSLLEKAVQVQVVDLSASSNAIATQILVAVSRPNLIQDPEQTRLRAEQAAQAVPTEVVEIRRGEVIAQAGQPITQSDFVLLDHFGMSRRSVNGLGVLGFAALISGAIAIFLIVEQKFHPGLRRRDYLLILLLTLSAPLLVALRLPATSLPVIGLLVGSFYGSALGVTVIALLSIALPIGMEVTWSYLLSGVAASLVGALMAGRLRSREELALLGGGVGLTQGFVYLLFSLIISTGASSVWYAVLSAAALQALIGIASSIVALGMSPYLENLFDLITPIRLAELSNPNRPLLKRLAAETPGTFQHTLFVATLAEAAARALGCNVELVRAGTLYHDIGKMHDPMGFIENQMGRPNKHEAIDNPWRSAAIIKKHVSEGLVMARRYRLPTAIQAFIPEHQGTMLIAYFFHEAQQRSKANADLIVDEANFRYDGPIPQSRETAIVMLADSCEAALRSLKDATPEEALAMVNRILRARWQDNQLAESGLTRGEMPRIAAIFVQVWQQFHHQRIAYPKLSPQPTMVEK